MNAVTNFTPTDEQRRFIEEHPVASPGIVDAGAGTGKTEVIARRVEWLVSHEHLAPESILLLTFANKAAAELAARVAQLLEPNSRLPHCSTFHAFAWEVLQKHCYEIGMSPDAHVIEEPEARLVFARAFDEWARDNTVEGTAAFPLRPFRSEELREGLFDVANQLKHEGRSLPEFRSRALAGADSFAKFGYRELRMPYKGVYKGQTHKILASIDGAGFARELGDERLRIEAAAVLFERYQARLDKLNALTFADLIARATRALEEHPDIRARLREKYACCIVDEYQDTDAGQHRLLLTLFEDLQGVAALGDVRQSIYDFRGAQPENVAAFRTATGCLSYPLTVNRRSVQEILDAAGSVAGEFDGAVQPLRAHRDSANAQVVRAASIWSEPHEYLTFDEQREHEARAVVKRIRQLLDAGREPRDIAILSRNKTKIKPMTDALLAAGVPFALVGGVGFYDAPEILDALAWIKLLADPFDSQALARAAASPGIGISDPGLTELLAGAERDPTVFARRLLVDAPPASLGPEDCAALERLRATLDILEEFSAMPLTEAVDAVLDRSGLQLSWELSGEPRAAQALANLRKLAIRAREFAAEFERAQAADFVAFMRELAAIEVDEREADVGDINAVRVSTIHAAKGLEWPVVFVVGVWPDNTRGRLIWVDDATGALLCREGPDEKEPFHTMAVRLNAYETGEVPRADDPDADKEREREERRLLYVAMTRARDELYVTGLRRRPPKDKPYASAHRYLESIYTFLKDRGWKIDDLEAGPELVLRSQNTIDERARNALPIVARERSSVVSATDRRRLEERTTVSFSSIQAYEQCPRRSRYQTFLHLPHVGRRHGDRPSAASESAEEPTFDALFGAGAFGRLVHRALELWALDRRSGAATEAAAAYVDRAATDNTVELSASQRERAVAAVGATVRLLADWMPKHIEAPFALEFSDGAAATVVVTGFIDLVASDPQSQLRLLDYKTGQTPADEYALQLAIYREAARRAYREQVTGADIIRIDERGVALERVADMQPDEIRRRVREAAEGLRRGDDTPKPGRWCWTCPFRAAPCEAYPRRRM